MHRSVAWILPLIFGYGLNALAQQPVAAPPNAQVAPPGPHAERPPAGHQTQDSNHQSPLTNGDVIKMVKGGVPESAILSSMQSSPDKFDLSPAALIGLRKAGVSQKIVDAMTAAGSGNGVSAASSTGQPAAGSSVVRKAGERPALKIKLGPPKAGPRIKNPHGVQANAAIIAVLQKQRQTADAEVTQMKPGIRPVGQIGQPAGQSPSTAAINDGTKSGSPAIQSQTKSSTSGNRAMAAMPSRVQKPATVGTIGPSQPSSAPGNSLSSTMVHATQLPTTALTCTHDPTTRILTISGAQHGAILSADPNYNLYTIIGCSLGPPSPNNKAWIYGANLHVDLQIQHWDENQIAWMFDSQLNGVNDQDGVHLVLHRADGQELDTGGYKFYAARETVVLGAIPALAKVFTAAQGGHFHMAFSTPANDANGSFAEVSRWVKANKDRPSGNVFIDGTLASVDKNGADFGFLVPYFDKLSGSDYFDFSNLVPSFTTDAFQMITWQPDPNSLCGGEADTISAGGSTIENWDANWDGNNIRVSSWATTYCTDLEVFAETYVKQSQYALQVWVTGPRGLDPWAGKPVTTSK